MKISDPLRRIERIVEELSDMAYRMSSRPVSRNELLDLAKALDDAPAEVNGIVESVQDSVSVAKGSLDSLAEVEDMLGKNPK
ncbi:MAG: hypothetical protein L0Z62_08070 [Gemmataceae bacterium]|nr:hypothetical protein [Gemmataceae bacterium]